jgi:hypothetical protein
LNTGLKLRGQVPLWRIPESTVPQLLIHAHVVRRVYLVDSRLLTLTLDLLLQPAAQGSNYALLFLLKVFMILVDLLYLAQLLVIIGVSHIPIGGFGAVIALRVAELVEIIARGLSLCLRGNMIIIRNDMVLILASILFPHNLFIKKVVIRLAQLSIL